MCVTLASSLNNSKKKSIKKEDYPVYNNLASILGQVVSIFGPVGQIIGSELGALLGAQLDSAIFGMDAEQKVTHGARLKNLQVQSKARTSSSHIL
jgi:hypothetical protein